MMRFYIRAIAGAIHLLELVFFWPRARRILEEFFLIRNLDYNPLVIVDVGIIRGQSTSLFSKWFPEAKIYGFEP